MKRSTRGVIAVFLLVALSFLVREFVRLFLVKGWDIELLYFMDRAPITFQVLSVSAAISWLVMFVVLMIEAYKFFTGLKSKPRQP